MCIAFADCVVFYYRLGTIQPLSNFSASSAGWVSWSLDILLRRPVKWSYNSLVKQPLLWAYSRFVGSASVCQPKTREQLILDLPDEHFVLVDLVKVFLFAHTSSCFVCKSFIVLFHAVLSW